MKGTRCVGAGIGTHEVVAGHAVSGRAGAAGGEVRSGGGVIVTVSFNTKHSLNGYTFPARPEVAIAAFVTSRAARTRSASVESADIVSKSLWSLT